MNYCCDAFKEFIPHFEWMKLDNELIMPHIYSGNERLRVRYCPSCGKHIRGIRIDIEEFLKH